MSVENAKQAEITQYWVKRFGSEVDRLNKHKQSDSIVQKMLVDSAVSMRDDLQNQLNEYKGDKNEDPKRIL